ncbi:RNA polymerase sigma factor [Bacteroides pyogenes]|uniref:RNA polymerase sigma factor n=1 Tax=Bacteroides pyogenes TaxID=310300 RepID=UPI000EFD1C41|nr:sigma-70 family RNA polymerase sigma factor [Bacteroides pyogenes]MBB3894913.1 RNA polymerase sigma factor (sigma-70 family) [Bacteroides pyogenes]
MHTTDEILLRAIAQKDKRAFLRFYERYSRVALCFVLSKVHHADVAKEIVQNFWLALWENPRMLRPDKDGCAKVFLMQYLRFRIYDIYRIAVPETVPIDETDIVSPLLAGADMEKEELLHIVCDALKNSTLLTKKTFWMRVDNISAKEVANELNTTPQTVHNTFSRALHTVREYIRKRYPEIADSAVRLFVAIYFFR